MFVMCRYWPVPFSLNRPYGKKREGMWGRGEHSYRQISFVLDFTFLLCSQCCILYFGWFPDVWILCADVSEHSVSSIFKGPVGDQWRWNWQGVPKRRHIKFRRREITQKKDCNKLVLIYEIWLHATCFWNATIAYRQQYLHLHMQYLYKITRFLTFP